MSVTVAALVGVATSAQVDVHKHMPALDGVRGVAVVLVILHHAYQFTTLRHPVDQAFDVFTASAWMGVDLFFVLSGFLITGILLDIRDSPRYFRAFYWRRLVRIFPLYYAYLAVVLFVIPRVTGEPFYAKAEANQWWLWTHLSNIPLSERFMNRGVNHFWSLAVEEQFYLVWPAIVYVLGRYRLLWLLAVLIPGTAVLRWYLASNGTSGQALYMLTWTRFDALAIGALLAVAARSTGGLLRWRRLAFAVAAVTIPALVWYAWTKDGLHYAKNTPLAVSLMYSGVGAMCAAVIVLILTKPTGLASRMMTTRMWRSLGKYSYGMYVFHIGIDSALRAYEIHPKYWYTRKDFHIPGFMLYMVLATGLTFAAAWVSWQILEKPFLALKGRYPYWDKPVADVVTSADDAVSEDPK